MQADINIKPECVVSSGCVPVKSEETDDEDMHKAADMSSSLENHSLPINIKQEAVKAEVKAEDEASTDDERSPEYVVSSSGYDPVKSEETDDDEQGEDTNTSNEQHLPIKVKTEVKTEDDVSTDDEYSSEMNEQAKPLAQPPNGKKRKASKEQLEESNGSVLKAARRTCSVEGCNRKAADTGTCMREHGGYNLCGHDGCTKAAQKGGVCIRHGHEAAVTIKACRHEGCKNYAQIGGVCVKHGAVVKKRKAKTCQHEGCTNNVQNGGVCAKHGAVVKRKTCSQDGCTKYSQKGGLCHRHHKQISSQSNEEKCSVVAV